MSERIDITESELIAAILAAEPGGTIDLRHGATSGELADLLGWSRGRTLQRLAAMKHAGQIEAVRVQRETLDDRLTLVAAYKLKTS